jgi:glutathione S-transferase
VAATTGGDAPPSEKSSETPSPRYLLTQYRLCPHSRSIRLALAELGIEPHLVEERPWEARPELLALNPSGELPVLEIEGGLVLAGAYSISEYLGETQSAHRAGEPAPGDDLPTGPLLFSGLPVERAEVRRLTDWFHNKLFRDVTRELLSEKVYARLAAGGPISPDPETLRAVRANLRYHQSYIGHRADRRNWLAGNALSFADLAAGAHLSSIDYLGDVPWEYFPSAKSWYQRLKSRPSFRSLLADRLPGTPPAECYADLDF